MMKVDKDDYDNKSDDERERDRRRRNERDLKPSRFDSAKDRDRSPVRGKRRGNRVYVSNIPYEYRWQELKDLFRDKVGEVSYVEMFVDENDKPRGCGVIEFSNSELAKEAVEKMHRHEINGRKLVVKEDNDVERDKYGRIVRGGGGGGGGGGVGGGGGGGGGDRGGRGGGRDRDRDLPSLVNGPSGHKFGNTFGLSTQFLESLGISGPLVPRVFVANLDYNVDEKKLREVFRLAGRVISCDLSTDKEGKSRGFGVIEFEHPVEAVQAISMFSNQTLFERKMSVRMDRVGDKGDGLPARLPEGLKGIGMGLGANGAPLQDVARNLPSVQTPSQPPLASVAAANSALTAAALAGGLGGLGGVGGLMGATTNDISSLASSLVGSSALAGGNPLATAQLLSSTGKFNVCSFKNLFPADVMGIRKQAAANLASRSGSLSLSSGSGLGPAFSGSSSVGRDFDSLSAALGGNSAFSASANSLGSDRRPLGSSSSSNNDTIVIKNLPPGTTWQMLRDKCRDAGDVKFAEMRAKDTGIVQFGSHWDAQRAINMLDGIRVDGRSLDVRFY